MSKTQRRERKGESVRESEKKQREINIHTYSHQWNKVPNKFKIKTYEQTYTKKKSTTISYTMGIVERQALIRRLQDEKLGKDEKYNNNNNNNEKIIIKKKISKK